MNLDDAVRREVRERAGFAVVACLITAPMWNPSCHVAVVPVSQASIPLSTCVIIEVLKITRCVAVFQAGQLHSGE